MYVGQPSTRRLLSSSGSYWNVTDVSRGNEKTSQLLFPVLFGKGKGGVNKKNRRTVIVSRSVPQFEAKDRYTTVRIARLYNFIIISVSALHKVDRNRDM